MGLLSRIDKIICESSPYTSTELTFNTWWGRTTQVYLKGNEVLWSPSWEFPTGSIVTEDDIDEMRRRGYVIIPWE